jgi:hypothetical protein
MHAALDITNVPNYASAIVTTNEIVDLICSVQTEGVSAQQSGTFGHRMHADECPLWKAKQNSCCGPADDLTRRIIGAELRMHAAAPADGRFLLQSCY